MCIFCQPNKMPDIAGIRLDQQYPVQRKTLLIFPNFSTSLSPNTGTIWLGQEAFLLLCMWCINTLNFKGSLFQMGDRRGSLKEWSFKGPMCPPPPKKKASFHILTTLSVWRHFKTYVSISFCNFGNGTQLVEIFYIN